MKIAVITAGGAGMFCGSCMQDNTLVRTLRSAGADAVLIPTYTPIRVDEENVSQERVFLGGINVYLDSAVPGWRRIPSWFTRWLNRPALIRILTRLSSSTDASRLGPLTVDMLSGMDGPQQREISELVQYLSQDLQPDVVLFSNALLSGVIPFLRRSYSGKILTLLQGDDIFLEGLRPPYKSRALALLMQNCKDCDGLLTHSQYYSQFMQQYLNLPASRFREIPLILEAIPRLPPQRLTGGNIESASQQEPGLKTLTIGYFARICPEKGVHHFLSAAGELARQFPHVSFIVAGFLAQQHRAWFEVLLRRAQQDAAPEQIRWLGSPATRDAKFEILQSLDLLCVPSEYQEPKGLYVLEAAALGIPALLPRHGAFPERLQRLGDGMLFDPHETGSLAQAMRQVIQAAAEPVVSLAGIPSPLPAMERRERLIRAVQEAHGIESTGPLILETIRELAGLHSDATSPSAASLHAPPPASQFAAVPDKTGPAHDPGP